MFWCQKKWKRRRLPADSSQPCSLAWVDAGQGLSDLLQQVLSPVGDIPPSTVFSQEAKPSGADRKCVQHTDPSHGGAKGGEDVR